MGESDHAHTSEPRHPAPTSRVAGLNAPGRVGQFLFVRSNGSLTSLYGLGALTAIGGDLILQRNGTLTSVTALNSLTEVGGDVGIKDNTSLITADAEALVLEIDSIGGTITITGNAPQAPTIMPRLGRSLTTTARRGHTLFEAEAGRVIGIRPLAWSKEISRCAPCTSAGFWRCF